MHGLTATILAVSVLTTPTDTIVLKSGEQIPIAGGVTLDGTRAVFRQPDGTLYSLPFSEIDVERTESDELPPVVASRQRTAAENQALEELLKAAEAKSLASRTLVVSDEEKQRLLEELRKSRGTPVPPRPYVPVTTSAEISPAGETLVVSRKSDEWYWREKARGYQEQVRQRKEDLQILIQKEQRLSDEILGLLSLGYNGDQFGYQVLSLVRTRDQIPQARLALERAERALAQFMDDARRQSILPGWLR